MPNRVRGGNIGRFSKFDSNDYAEWALNGHLRDCHHHSASCNEGLFLNKHLFDQRAAAMLSPRSDGGDSEVRQRSLH
jgi:hypothetical protein